MQELLRVALSLGNKLKNSPKRISSRLVSGDESADDLELEIEEDSYSSVSEKLQMAIERIKLRLGSYRFNGQEYLPLQTEVFRLILQLSYLKDDRLRISLAELGLMVSFWLLFSNSFACRRA